MNRYPGGFTLVELMISLALGSVLCLGVTTLLAFAQRAYLQDEELARLQENGRHALKFLERELAMAGFLGRLQPDGISKAAPIGTDCYAYILQPERGLEHFDDIGVEGLSPIGSHVPDECRRPGQYQPGSDVFILRRTLDAPHRDFGETAVPLFDQTLYLAASGHTGSLLPGAAVSAMATSVWQYHPQQLFVRRYSVSDGDGVPSLCRQRLSPNRAALAPLECLVEGVEMLQLEFGLDTDGDRLPDRYSAIPTAGDLERVVLVRIFLLLRAAREVAGYRDNRSYRLGETVFQAPGDGYYRLLFSSAVLVRNSDVFRS